MGNFTSAVQIGKNMREAQSSYFSTKEKGRLKIDRLNHARDWERKFSEAVDELEKSPIAQDYAEFIELAKQLIEAQKAAFPELTIQNYGSPLIKQSKEREKQFDKYIARFFDNQQSLF